MSPLHLTPNLQLRNNKSSFFVTGNLTLFFFSGNPTLFFFLPVTLYDFFEGPFIRLLRSRHGKILLSTPYVYSYLQEIKLVDHSLVCRLCELQEKCSFENDELSRLSKCTLGPPRMCVHAWRDRNFGLITRCNCR